MPIAILTVLKALGAGFWDFASSRAGQIIIAAVVAWFWSEHRTNNLWELRVAAQRAAIEAAYKAEVARQEVASREIAAAATARAEEDAALVEALRKRIADFNSKEPAIVPHTIQLSGKPVLLPRGGCSIDDSFARVVRDLDAAGSKAKAPRRTKHVR